MKQNYLKIAQLLFLFLINGKAVFAQDYTWMKGSNIPDQPGNYGTMGVPSANTTPGARELTMSWKDAAGDLWLFGGTGFGNAPSSGLLNDLWKYSTASNQWTWMKGADFTDQPGLYGFMGVGAASNSPGGRTGSVTWTDASGNLWLFGGDALDEFGMEDLLNDLWKYDVATNEWTWVRGSNTGGPNSSYGTMGIATPFNEPGGRAFSMGWADASGNLWLFGGIGYDAISFGRLNDLWKYDIATNEWTWINGSDIAEQNGNYGTMGVAAPTNMPGSRQLSATWQDASGNLWLYGGSALDATSSVDDAINDLWMYNIAANQWTWMGGDDFTGSAGVYGTMNVPAPSNIPGARFASISWSNGGDFYLFGGLAVDAIANQEIMNDVWKYNIATNQWTWLKGSDIGSPGGTFGTQGVSSPANTPSGKVGACGWKDASGTVWLFGGIGNDGPVSFSGDFNDLWKLGCTANLNVSIAASDNSACLGQSLTFTATGASTYSWSSGQTGSVVVVTPTVASVTSLTVYPKDANGCTGTATTTAFVIYSLPVLSAGASASVICRGVPATLTVSGADSYAWAANGTTLTSTASSITFSPLITTTYVVTGTDAAGCENTATVTQVVDPCTGIDTQTKTAATIVVYPNPNSGTFTIKANVFGVNTQLVVFNTLGQKVAEENLNTEQTQVKTQLQKGVYYYTVMSGNKSVSTGKMLIE